jgi:hypothetical protein
VWAYHNEEEHLSIFTTVPPGLRWDYWCPAKDDIPEPPKKETQADRDMEFLRDWDGMHPNGTFYDLAIAALAYERAEVAKMLPDFEGHSCIEGYNARCQSAIEAIRARCGKGGAT